MSEPAPTEGVVSDPPVAGGGLSLRLTYAGELDWEAMLGYLAARAMGGVEYVSVGVYRRTVLVDGDPGVIGVTSGGSSELLVTSHPPHWGGHGHVVRQVRRLFNLDSDVRAANEALGRDVLLADRIARRPGVRVPGAWDPFEIGIRAIIGQQITVAGAGTIAARLVRRHGRAVPGLGQFGLTHLFPSAEVLAGADLTGVGLTEARSSGHTQLRHGGRGRFGAAGQEFRLADQVAALEAVTGLGPWTAQYLALRMGEPDAFPSTDLGLRRAIEGLSGAPVAARDVGKLAERWRPWRAHAAIHLWLARPPTVSTTWVPVRPG